MRSQGIFAVIVGLGAMMFAADGIAWEGSRDSRLVTPWGMSINVGGGYLDFASKGARNHTDPGGIWEARVGVGTRARFGLEAAYIGAAQNINALGLDRHALLVGNGVEGNFRINFTAHAWQPYAVVGAGWRHYSLSRVDTNTSDIAQSDDVFELPLGAGMSYHIEQFILDLRGTFRPASRTDLLGKRDMDNWSAKLGMGMEF